MGLVANMAKLKRFVKICDPGHGWLKVTRREYDASGFKASPYSYQSGNFVYLEEDCDMYGFLKAAGYLMPLMPFNDNWAIDCSKVEIVIKYVKRTSIRSMQSVRKMTREEYEARLK